MKAITPVVAVILLIVMTVGIAAFTFVWMQNFMQSLTTKSEQTIKQLERPQFQIVSVVPNSTTAPINLSIVLYNSGTVPINLNDISVLLKIYWAANDTLYKTETKNSNWQGTLSPGQDTTVSLVIDSYDLTKYYYELILLYRGYRTSYMVRV